MKKILLKWYPLILILIPAAALRINLMFHRGTLWFDETYSVRFSSIPSMATTIKYWVLETNPPFYHLFLRFYLPFIDEKNEMLLRIPSVIFSIITITLLYVYAQKMFSRRTAIISSVFLTLNQIHIKYSTEIRMYSLFSMLVMCSFVLFHKIIFEKKNTKLLWFAYTLVTTSILYTHLSGPSIILIQLLVLLYAKINKNLVISWFKSQCIAVGSWCIWFIPSIIAKIGPEIKSAWYLNDPKYTQYTIVNSIIAPFIEFNSGNHSFTTAATIALPFIAYIFYKKMQTSSQEKKNYAFLVATWAFLPIIFSSLAGLFIPRYIMSAYLGLYILAAYIIDSYTKTSKKKFALVLCFTLIWMLPSAISRSYNTVVTWKTGTDYIEKNETPNSITLLFFSDGFTFRDYYQGKQPVVDIYTRQDNLPLYERIVRYNWNKHEFSDEEARNWINDKISENNANKIFLIVSSSLHNDYRTILLKEGWTIKNITRSEGDFTYGILELDAPVISNCNII